VYEATIPKKVKNSKKTAVRVNSSDGTQKRPQPKGNRLRPFAKRENHHWETRKWSKGHQKVNTAPGEGRGRGLKQRDHKMRTKDLWTSWHKEKEGLVGTEIAASREWDNRNQI